MKPGKERPKIWTEPLVDPFTGKRNAPLPDQCPKRASHRKGVYCKHCGVTPGGKDA